MLGVRVDFGMNIDSLGSLRLLALSGASADENVPTGGTSNPNIDRDSDPNPVPTGGTANLDPILTLVLTLIPTGGAAAGSAVADSSAVGVGFDVLVDATGARCEMFNQIGFEQVHLLCLARRGEVGVARTTGVHAPYLTCSNTFSITGLPTRGIARGSL